MSQSKTGLAFLIDKLTNSIENTVSGEIFDTVVTQVTLSDAKQIKKKDWTFNWYAELKEPGRQVYKLTTVQNPNIIHGLISLTDKGDHIFMDLIESSGFNKGRKKLYNGVAGNLVAFGCKLAFEKGFDGVVSFVAKSQLILHYRQTLGAKLFAGNRMFIDTAESRQLVNRYFKDVDHGKL